MSSDDLFVGIDIGGTNTVVGLLKDSGDIVSKDIFATCADKPVILFQENLKKTLKHLISSKKNMLQGIGIGMPGANSDKGYVNNLVNFAWGNVNLAEMIRDQYNMPVLVINDAKAAALGEIKFGQARDLENFIQITLGTGLGSSFVAHKRIINGNDGLASEMGHTKVANKNRLCKCGKKGCLETFVSASGVCRTVFELLNSDDTHSPLREYNLKDLTSHIVTDWAEKGDPTAIKAYAITGGILGEKLADFVHVFNPQAILISGGLAAAGKYLFEPMEEALNDNLLHSHKNKTQIRISDPDINYAVLGAASLIMDKKD